MARQRPEPAPRGGPRGATPRGKRPRREAPPEKRTPAGGSPKARLPGWSPTVWLRQHRLAARDTLFQVLRTPVSSLLTVTVLGIALALPAAFYLFLKNVDQLSGAWDGNVEMSVFLRMDTADQDALALAGRLRGREDIADVRYLSPGDALAEFERLSGLGDVLREMDGNPLPAVLLVRPGSGYPDFDSAGRLRSELAALPEVDAVQLDLEWLQRLQQIMVLGERIGEGLALLLGGAVLLVIGNTIRLMIENRRREIHVLSMVGGTPAYVRRPLLYTGCWFGLGGGICAWIFLAAGVAWLRGPAERLAALYESKHSLLSLGPSEVAILLACSMALGWIGAWVAVRRHLAAVIED